MNIRTFSVGILTVAFFASTGAAAAPVTYTFSGTMTQSKYSGPRTSPWRFAAGQSFSGSFVYDADAITRSYVEGGTSTQTFTRYTSPILSFQFQIDLGTSLYSYSVPLVARDNHHAVISTHISPDGLEGMDLVMPIMPVQTSNRRWNAPDYVPSDAYMGIMYPFDIRFTLVGWNDKSVLDVTGPDHDWSRLFQAIQGNEAPYVYQFKIDFAEPDAVDWPERNRHFIAGYLDKVELANLERGPAQVPEPGAFGMLGIGLVGLGLARRRKAA